MHTVIWNSLSRPQQQAQLERPAQRGADAVSGAARQIIEQVRRGGDGALFELTEKFDAVRLDDLAVSAAEFRSAESALSPAQHAALEHAIANVTAFHAAQKPQRIRVETTPGVVCERISLPIRAVGLYVPAGSAPLPSTAVMLAVPAAIAGCPTRIMCTPPGRDGLANAAVLVAARKAGVECIFKVGGAQAVAAMAYGTASIAKCDKVFGPGNPYVTAAKLLVSQDSGGAAADLPAGPTEVMVIGDAHADAGFVAADLLAQAEHGVDAQALLVTPSPALAQGVARELVRQAPLLSRCAILRESMQSISLIVTDTLEIAFEIANAYAPEHLLLEMDDARAWLPRVTAAGAVFLGSWSPESIGDYCAGPNHTLPTYGYARCYSGLCLEDFQKRITVSEASPRGLQLLGPTAQVLSHLEGLDAHAAAVAIRLAALA
jgi:histidinol dehydrogenase